jgi:hypothetical protein
VITLDEPDVLDASVIPARPWGGWTGVEYVECVGLMYAFDFTDEVRTRHAQVGQGGWDRTYAERAVKKATYAPLLQHLA